MTAVAIYARYSSDQQRDASIEDQIRLCRERAEREGWRIHNHYTDHGLSGASLMRPGVQMLLQDAAAGRFQIILSEALDRLSRDQEDIAGIYKRMRFAGVRIVTLSEGEVSDLHIGLKGTMNALYLKDLADKTRRGLRGRIEAGRSGGGNCYGYDVVRRLGTDGQPVTGERAINEAEAAIVRRIFTEYAAGASPKALARQLNREGIPGPFGKTWGPSTIHGHRGRGTGILNNALYAGTLVWNRLRYVKDPETGKRVSRPNPSEEWITRPVPALRIVDDPLWERVRARQTTLETATRGKPPVNICDRRRPRYLFSGLLKCGNCGASFVKVSTEHFGCGAAKLKATCSNTTTVRRDAIEAAVLDGLQNHLMDPALCAAFAEEYAREMNRLRIAHNATLEAQRAELTRIDRETDRLIDAIAAGTPAARVKGRMWQLEHRKTELQAAIEGAETFPVLVHPAMGTRYREEVRNLVTALNDPERRTEAAEIIRGLVDRIVLTPDPAEPKGLTIDLEGHLAGILRLASGDKSLPANNNRPASWGDGPLQTMLVAGRGFEPLTFRL